jgi:hypothetical protein
MYKGNLITGIDWNLSIGINQKKNPGYLLEGSGIDFIRKATTYSPAFAVPSALMGLTSLFGMGRGGTPLL